MSIFVITRFPVTGGIEDLEALRVNCTVDRLTAFRPLERKKEVSLYPVTTRQALCGIGLFSICAYLGVSGANSSNFVKASFGFFGALFFGGGVLRVFWHKMAPTGQSKPRPSLVAFRGSGQVPTISISDQEELSRLVACFANYNVFRPEVPDPTFLAAGAADYGLPISLDSLLVGLYEAERYHSSFLLERYTSNLCVVPEQIEQTPGHVADQISQISDLSAGQLNAKDISVRIESNGQVFVRATLNGSPFSLNYAGSAGHHSSILLHQIAVLHDELRTGSRFLVIENDFGSYITLTDENALPGLIEELGHDAIQGARIHWLSDSAYAYEAVEHVGKLEEEQR